MLRVSGLSIRHSDLGGQLVYEKRGDIRLYCFYSGGQLTGIRYITAAGTILNYYFTFNSRGDIIGIYTGSGELRATYQYDAWGKVISVKDQDGNEITSQNHVANINPFRYRGYYYDTETALYYLQSRYCDPEIGRFINADDMSVLQLTQGEVLGTNLFAYCANNPVNYSDPTGCNGVRISRQAGSAATFLAVLMVVISAGSSNFWNPAGWILLAVAGVVLIVYGVWSLASYLSDKSLRADLALISFASTAATPPPPNKGGKGTRTSSTELYNKKGYRIDVENPGNRQGQIHLQKGKAKYIYNVKDQAFHIGKSDGKLAPKAIQGLLKDKKVIKAIAKGLKILGY